jgi:DNA-binding response OmpR family regulator
MRILVVEDEHLIAQSLKKGLEQEHYTVDLSYTGTEGYDLAAAEQYDAIILDLMLPGMDGITVCRRLRTEGIHTPVLMLTAKSQVPDRVHGLDAGADDYLPKPFAFEELLARLRALTRRPQETVGTILATDDIRLDTVNFTVSYRGKNVELSSREFALLEYMLRHKGMILTKDQIIEHVWDYEADILPNTVEVYVRKLRNKLSADAITTIRGFGYRMG